MKVWIVQIGEPIVGIDEGARSGRCNMLAQALAQRGHAVTWWNSTFHHFRKSYRFRGHTTVELPPSLTVRLLHGVPSYRRNTSIRRVLNQRSIARQFSKIAPTLERPDLIYACLPAPELCEQAVRFARESNIPVVVDIRDPWPDLYLNLFPKVLRSLARIALGPEYRRSERIFRGATALTAVSTSYLNWALERAARPASPHDRAFLIGYTAAEITAPVDPAAIREFGERHGIKRENKLITFCGVFGSSYDLETVVECAALLEKGGRTDVQFVLAGHGDKAETLRRQAAGLHNVVFTGWLDQSSLRTLIAMSSIGLCAYGKEATQSLPNKPFEYMAAGLPQISSLKGELEDLLHLHQIGLFYRAGDAASLRDQVLRIVDSPSLQREMSQRAAETFRRHFDASHIYPAFAEYLEKTADRFPTVLP